MFKNYLRVQPAPVQLLIFLSFWCALMLLGLFIQPLYIKAAVGISADQLQQFAESEIYKYPNVIFISNALFQLFTFLLPALIFAYLADPEPRKYLGGNAPGHRVQPLWVIVMAVSLIAAVGPLADWLKQIDLGSVSRELDKQREGFIKAYLRSGNTWSVLRSLFLIAVIPAFCEELFFRGIIMKFAQSMFKKWWLSILISAVLFSAFHTSISEFIPIFLAGVLLGWVYYITSSLWMNILLHLLFNGTQALLGIYSDPKLEHSLEAPSIVVAIFAGGLLFLALCIWGLYKKRSPLPAGWSVVWKDKENLWMPGEDTTQS